MPIDPNISGVDPVLGPVRSPIHTTASKKRALEQTNALAFDLRGRYHAQTAASAWVSKITGAATVGPRPTNATVRA